MNAILSVRVQRRARPANRANSYINHAIDEHYRTGFFSPPPAAPRHGDPMCVRAAASALTRIKNPTDADSAFQPSASVANSARFITEDKAVFSSQCTDTIVRTGSMISDEWVDEFSRFAADAEACNSKARDRPPTPCGPGGVPECGSEHPDNRYRSRPSGKSRCGRISSRRLIIASPWKPTSIKNATEAIEGRAPAEEVGEKGVSDVNRGHARNDGHRDRRHR